MLGGPVIEKLDGVGIHIAVVSRADRGRQFFKHVGR